MGRGGRSCTLLLPLEAERETETETGPAVGLVGEAEDGLLEDEMGMVMEEMERGKRGELWISGLLAERRPLMVAESVSTPVMMSNKSQKQNPNQSQRPINHESSRLANLFRMVLKKSIHLVIEDVSVGHDRQPKY